MGLRDGMKRFRNVPLLTQENRSIKRHSELFGTTRSGNPINRVKIGVFKALFSRPITNPLYRRFQESTGRLIRQGGLAKLGGMSAIVTHEV